MHSAARRSLREEEGPGVKEFRNKFINRPLTLRWVCFTSFISSTRNLHQLNYTKPCNFGPIAIYGYLISLMWHPSHQNNNKKIIGPTCKWEKNVGSHLFFLLFNRRKEGRHKRAGGRGGRRLVGRRRVKQAGEAERATGEGGGNNGEGGRRRSGVAASELRPVAAISQARWRREEREERREKRKGKREERMDANPTFFSSHLHVGPKLLSRMLRQQNTHIYCHGIYFARF